MLVMPFSLVKVDISTTRQEDVKMSKNSSLVRYCSYQHRKVLDLLSKKTYSSIFKLKVAVVKNDPANLTLKHA